MIDCSSVRVAVQAHTEIGESPSWDERAGLLRFVDAHAGTIHRFDPADGSLTSCSVGQAIGAVVVRESGGIVAAVRDGIGVVDESTGALDLIAPIELDEPRHRMNDAKCDPAGRLWAGTMALGLTPGAGSLYRILPDHSVTKVVGEVTCSNGLGWSPEGDRMYYVDTFAGVDVFDFELETGEVSNRRRFADVTPQEVPDGLAVDSEGHVWIAVFGDACVRRYSPDGRLDGRLELPGRQPTSVAFGGDDLGDLYITTATIEFGEKERPDPPDAGATLVCRPGVSGTPVHAFGG
jgi:sugar lactone lactonase YvrE